MRVSRAIPTDFLLPFFQLPGPGATWAMTIADDGTLYSETMPESQLVINGSPVFATTPNGIGYATLNGTTDYFTQIDSSLNSPSNRLTAFAVHRPFDTATTTQHIISKWGTGGNFSWRLVKSTALRAGVSGDGATEIAKTNAAPVASWQLSVLRYQGSVALDMYNSLQGTNPLTETSGIPATLFNTTGNLDIGTGRGSGNVATNFYQGDIAVVGYRKALLDNTHILSLIQHCKRFQVG